MTTSEIKKKIDESPNLEWFKTKSVTFNFPHIGYKNDIQGVSAIYEFVNQQVTGWENIKSTLPANLANSIQYFKDIRELIIKLVDEKNRRWDTQDIDYQWRDIQRKINNEPQYKFYYDYIFTYEQTEVEFLIDIYNTYPEAYQGAYNYVIDKVDFRDVRREYFKGYMLAYEFSLQGQTDILSRSKKEKASINKLKNDFQKHILRSETELIAQLTRSETKLMENLTQYETKSKNHLNSVSMKFDEYFKVIEESKISREALFDDWFETSKSDFNEFDKNSKTTTKKLEETYQEKLKLEEPARYWSTRAIKLRKQGWFALITLLILVLATSVFLGQLLWKTPEQIYISFFGGDKTSAIRWSIVYITLISFVAFGIRAIAKVMFSCFHLARDSEERHSLTYFYLALLKDSKVDDKDKQLIMQSLFSRAETGLLKDDSSPTMPNDIINKFLNK